VAPKEAKTAQQPAAASAPPPAAAPKENAAASPLKNAAEVHHSVAVTSIFEITDAPLRMSLLACISFIFALQQNTRKKKSSDSTTSNKNAANVNNAIVHGTENASGHQDQVQAEEDDNFLGDGGGRNPWDGEEVVFDFESTVSAKAFVLSGDDQSRAPRGSSRRIWSGSKAKDAAPGCALVHKKEAQKEWRGESALTSSAKKSCHSSDMR